MQQALLRIFKTTQLDVAISAFNNVNEDLSKSMLWLDENIPREYEKPEDIQRAYDWLSKADVFMGRIRRWQHWRFLVYVNAFLTGGIAISKTDNYRKVVDYIQTKRLLKIWMANMKYQKRKSIAQKISSMTHISTKRALNDTLPYIKHIFKNKNESDKIAHYLELDAEEIKWLRR